MKSIYFSLIFIFCIGCKEISFLNSHLKSDQDEPEVKFSLAYGNTVHQDLVKFYKVLSGDISSVSDSWFRKILPNVLPESIEISKVVTLSYQEPEVTGAFQSDIVSYDDNYIGMATGSKILIWKNLKDNTWKPFSSVARSILESGIVEDGKYEAGKVSLEDKVRWFLDAKIYEKKRIDLSLAVINTVEFMAELVPVVGGWNEFVNRGHKMGLVWIAGDIASFGLASKINAVRKASQLSVLGLSTVRIGHNVYEATQGRAGLSNGIDVFLAVVEGGLAAYGLGNFKLRSAMAIESVDDVIASGKKVFPDSDATAESLAKELKRSVDDIKTNGLTSEEFAKLAGRKIDGGAVLFGKGAAYQNVYDSIIYYPQYQKAAKYHVGAVERAPKGGVVIEAGGGTGNMTRMSMDARPDLNVYMVDFNEAMAEHAIAKGIPKSHLSMGSELGNIEKLHINGRRVLDGQVDTIFSHSVIWNLNDPSAFFAESARALKKGGILSVSTIKSDVKDLGKYFVQSIEEGLKPAVSNGRVTREAAETFVEQNASVAKSLGEAGSAVRSTLSESDIRAYAKKFGFDVIDISGCYVVPTPDGLKPFFIQFQLRKI